jgi:energy-coupling factor transport system ATP-binding protein
MFGSSTPDLKAPSRVLHAEQVGFYYPGFTSLALSSVTITLKSSEAVGMVGLSGSGKSTFGRLCKGMYEQTEGWFAVMNNYSGSSSHPPFLPCEARRSLVGWVEARPEIQLFAETVRNETAFGPANQGFGDEELDKRIHWALSAVGLEPSAYLSRHPRSLSGGEKRRLALASVAAMHFSYYIFDEPTASLDPEGVTAFQNLIGSLKERGCGVLWLTHDLDSLPGSVDRLVGLDRGRLVFNQPAVEVDWEQLKSAMSQGGMPSCIARKPLAIG